VGSILGASQQIGDKTNVTNSDTSLTIVSASTRAMAVLISQLRPCRATTHREFLLELTCSAGIENIVSTALCDTSLAVSESVLITWGPDLPHIPAMS
jgi:hypothetical protein